MIKVYFLFSLISIQVFAYESTHIKQFNLKQCSTHSCVQVYGALAFLSAGHEIIVGFNTTLEVQNQNKKTFRNYNCLKFIYKFKNQQILCDNTGSKIDSSMRFDANLNMTTIPPESSRSKT